MRHPASSLLPAGVSPLGEDKSAAARRPGDDASIGNETIENEPVAGDNAAESRTSFRLPVTYRGIPIFAATCDIIIIAATAIIAGLLHHYTISPIAGETSRSMAAAVFVAVLFVTATWMRRLYQPNMLMDGSAQAQNLIGAWTGAFLLLASGVFTWGAREDLSPTTIVYYWVIGGVALLAHRQIWRHYLPQALVKGVLKGRNAIVISWDKPMTPYFSRLLREHGYNVLRQFELGASPESADKALEAVIGFVHGQSIDDIFLAPSILHAMDIRAVATALRILPIPITMMPDAALAELVMNPRYQLGSTIALEIQRPPLDLSERAVKRAFDILISSLALMALLPLFAFIAAAIALDSRGPVLFLQTRSGFNGRPFKIFKFRSMTVAEDGDKVTQAQKNDKRVTRIGALLRRTSIDELPQLLNVLRGDMSIVGPRPHAMAHDKYFAECVDNYAFRHHVKAGITGWAQVNGSRGETDTVDKIQRRVDLDLWYVKHWSLKLDVAILLKTVSVVLQGENAF